MGNFVGPMIFEPTSSNFWSPNPITTHQTSSSLRGDVAMGQNPGTPGEHQNSWDLWMWITHYSNGIYRYWPHTHVFLGEMPPIKPPALEFDIPILGQITIIPGETLQMAKEMTGFWLVKSKISLLKSSNRPIFAQNPPCFPLQSSFSMGFPWVFPAFSHPRGIPWRTPVARLDLLLRRVGQRVLRQQLVDGAVEAFRRGAVVAQDVDHQGVVEQTYGKVGEAAY